MHEVGTKALFLRPDEARADAAIGEHHLQTEHLAPGITMGDDIHSAGVCSDSPSNRRRVPRREVDAIGETCLLGVLLEGADRHSRAGRDLAGGTVDSDIVEPTKREDHLAVVGNRASDEAGIATLRNDRMAELPTDDEDPADLVHTSGPDDGGGRPGTPAGRVNRVAGHHVRIDQYLVRSNRLDQGSA